MAVVTNSDLMSPTLLNKGERKKKAGIYPLFDYNYFPFLKIIYPFANPILFPLQLLREMQELRRRSENKTASCKLDFNTCTSSFNNTPKRSSGINLGSP